MTTKYIVKNASNEFVEGNINFQNNISFEGRIDNGYRTYKALLTHIPPQDLTSNPNNGLIVGETYTIANYVEGDDFLNVGASANTTGVTFLATGRIPRGWAYGSRLTVDTPTLVVNVLENTFDYEIVWELNPFGEGSYIAYFSGGNQTFPREKTSIITSQITPYDFFPLTFPPTIYSTIDTINNTLDNILIFQVIAYDGSNNIPYNGLLYNTTVEIKSYVGFKPIVYFESWSQNTNQIVSFNVILVNSGSSTVTEYGVVWSTSPNPTINDNKIIFFDSFGTYSQINIPYDALEYRYVKAYAINNSGVAYDDTNQKTTGIP